VRRFTARTRTLLAGLLVVPLLACGMLDPRHDQSHFYVLATSDELGAPAASSKSIAPATVGLGPIELPSYVRRAELVERRGATGLEPARDERWGEPIESGVVRVLARDLELALGVKTLALHPWYADAAPQWQVKVTFARFEREEGGQVVVAARWQIVETATRSVRVERDARIARPIDAHDDAATVRALSEGLSELSAQIAGSFEQANATAAP
jgi:uncharacterized lipoprotein YmbA